MQNKTKLTFTNPYANQIKKQNLVGGAYATFINTNGGIANFGVQLLPNAIGKNNVMFGGGTLATILKPTQGKVCNANGVAFGGGYGHASQMLWAIVNGLPPQAINNGKLVKQPKHGFTPITTIPTAPKTVPLAHIQYVHKNSGSCINSMLGANIQGFKTNMLLAVLCGSKSLTPSGKNHTLGTPFAKLVSL